jgi:hypothetical protein
MKVNHRFFFTFQQKEQNCVVRSHNRFFFSSKQGSMGVNHRFFFTFQQKEQNCVVRSRNRYFFSFESSVLCCGELQLFRRTKLRGEES